MNMPRLLLSAAHKSSGKTTVGIALCAALRQRGIAVQPFKKGPDYIDPMWLARASARDCFNLDPFLMTQAQIQALFHATATNADISLVEGNKGLYDGLALDGSNSNAALAHMLGLPVLLVLDAKGMTRGIAPLILGYQAFDRNIRIGGVILNNLGGSRHEAKLRAVIEHYTDVPVLGAVAHDERLRVTERHLGLMPHAEVDDAGLRIDAMAALIAGQVDLQRVIALARSAPPVTWSDPLAPKPPQPHPQRDPVRIGVARDKVFGFYYADDLAAMERAGAQLVPFDTLRDAHLPAVDGLFIGGGFPEMFMDPLEANASLRREIAAAIEAGLPAYAECGGLMYLARSLRWQGRTARMVGAIGADVQMHDKPVGRGYVLLEPTAQHPWAGALSTKAHEFHYSKLENLDPALQFAYRVKRGFGVDGANDGIVHRNLLASYAHLRGVQGDGWPSRFVAHVRQCRLSRSKPVPGEIAARPTLQHAEVT